MEFTTEELRALTYALRLREVDCTDCATKVSAPEDIEYWRKQSLLAGDMLMRVNIELLSARKHKALVAV